MNVGHLAGDRADPNAVPFLPPPPPLAPAAPRLPLAPALQQGWERLVQGAAERQLRAWPKPAWLWAADKRC